MTEQPKPEACTTAEQRGMQLFTQIPLKEIPALASSYASYLVKQHGFCGEVMLTAYTRYAQCMECLPCSDDLYIASQLDRDWFAKAIKAERKKCSDDLAKAMKEYEEKVNLISGRILERQNQCPHYEVTYYPDPSGNSDSCYICELCGKDRRHKSNLGGIWKEGEKGTEK